MELYRYVPGPSPVLLSIPHAGTHVPETVRTGFAEAARPLPDTDWHVDRLYAWAETLGVSLLVATHHRYVIDLNRPPDDTPLYAGATTGLCPTVLFDGTPIYQPGAAPDAAACRARLERYWQPYHDRLRTALHQLRDEHGHAVFLDAHSIRSRVPRLFDGRLPDLNLGTDDGRSAAPALIERAAEVLHAAPGYSAVVDGRFKGGYITRHYGRPEAGIHAVQLELAQATYMDEDPPYLYLPRRAEALQEVLRRFVDVLLRWRPG